MMASELCISVRFIHPVPLFHGQQGDGEPEWPPSPLRLYQALFNAVCLRDRGVQIAPELRQALQSLESLQPMIITPQASISTVGLRMYVPHNLSDLVTAAWHRGNLKESIAQYRVEKDHRPVRIQCLDNELPAIHYLYPRDSMSIMPENLLKVLRPAVRSITHLGWGIDQVAADASLVDFNTDKPPGEVWFPAPAGGRRLRVPKRGIMNTLLRRYDQFLSRLRDGIPVSPLNDQDMEHVPYRRETDPLPRPFAVFRLLDENDDTVSYPQRKLIHIAGMVRHLAIKTMRLHPPLALNGAAVSEWVERYVAGHQASAADSSKDRHSQFSYIPLPSIGHYHTDPGIRRVVITAPSGDEKWLNHLVERLQGQELQPEVNTTLPPGTRLQVIDQRRNDGVREAYTREARRWASVTPVILPGHDDHRPAKTRKLIEKALLQSGIDQECEFEWSPFPYFPKSLTAHKYGRDGKPSGYLRPDHLLSQTAVHLRVTFAHEVPGPITIGAGRHCGFGLMAAVKS